MKQIYFVRHGQTNHNIQRIFQDDLEHLNKAGVQQAKLVTEKIVSNKAEVVVVSPLLRAQETARIIVDILGCPIETLDAIREMMNPPIIRGKSYDDPIASEAYEQWIRRLLVNETYGQEDIENFFDLSARAEKILNTLTSRNEEKIVVVTHSVIIRAIIARAIMGDKTSPEIIEHFQNHIKIQNASVISLTVQYVNNKIQYKILFE